MKLNKWFLSSEQTEMKTLKTEAALETGICLFDRLSIRNIIY